ncbi:MAG: acylphosphatase [Nitrososphaerota archaeon]|nr:acylphosphatase [Nitrososphaerota archaeon]MDG6922020.1 acylphosphatase [Nitrososphaerota archaeon]
MSREIESFNVIISGKVQGVFFRASMKRVAEECELVGWVRNLEDGRVESLVQGRWTDIQRILEWCKTGPRNAAVSKVEVKKVNPQADLRNFSIVY